MTRDKDPLNGKQPVLRNRVERKGTRTRCLIHDKEYYHASNRDAAEAMNHSQDWCPICEAQMGQVQDRGVVQ